MSLRSAPYWYDRFPASRRPDFPRLRGDLDARVVIIGGGLAGCACAWACASARIPVVLIEANRIGSGATGGASGLVRQDFDTAFGEAAGTNGLRAARAMWQAMRRSALDLQAVLRRLNIRCELAPQGLLRLAPPEASASLRREYDARREAGLDLTWGTATAVLRETGLATGGAIRTHAAVLDPYRACVGLVQAAVNRGVAVFERSPARRIRPGRTAVEVTTAGGTLRADAVIVATSAPLPDLRPLRRHLQPRHGYGVVTDGLPAPVRHEVGRRASVLEDAAEPRHLIRWLREDRVLVEGAVQDPVAARLQPQALVQRTGQLMYELSLLYPAISGTRPAWSWACAFDETTDRLPYIGTHRNFPRHLFALGLARHGPGAAWLAARVLTRHLAGEPVKGDELFGFSRIL